MKGINKLIIHTTCIEYRQTSSHDAINPSVGAFGFDFGFGFGAGVGAVDAGTGVDTLGTNAAA